MRSIKINLSKKSLSAWDAAVLLLENYLNSKLKADQVLEQLGELAVDQSRASCQSLFLGALRHGHRSRAAFQPLLRKSPRPRVQAILYVAAFECDAEASERHPKIVHHAVERSKQLVNRFEQRFLNAVLRQLPAALAAIDEADAPADFYSHPAWLVQHWMAQFGDTATRALLQWNQRIPELRIRLYQQPALLPEFLLPTDWPGFYSITRSANWQHELQPLLCSGTAYIKDPSTRLAPELLAPGPGMDVLDLCAAPGGKSYELAHHMQHRGRIVAVDLPGKRIARLEENLRHLSRTGVDARILESDLLSLTAAAFRARQLPEHYDAVMLDAPCSNTGVIQRRTDVKWRLLPKDIPQCAELQLKLLAAAATWVKPGGRLVYSTCSIEHAENHAVVDAFLRAPAGALFKQKESVISLPWQTGHDGAGVHLLERSL